MRMLRTLAAISRSGISLVMPMAPKHCMACSVTSHAISVATTLSIEISWRTSRPCSIFLCEFEIYRVFSSAARNVGLQ